LLLVAGQVTGDELNLIDYGITILLLGIILLETIADQQQWNYHFAKALYKEKSVVADGYTKAEVERGFVTRGLWAWSRHPNFAAEQGTSSVLDIFSYANISGQAVWLSMYVWGCLITHTTYNWSSAGIIGLLGIFQGSTWLTELITVPKYAQYKEYQAKVGKFLPSSLSAVVLSPPPKQD
jgi:steroid 5-alpha reductase family enzyme